MIHFFVTFSNDASNSPFAKALRNLGVDYRIFSRAILLRYQHRAWLILIGLPKLLMFAISSAWRSLVFARPLPEAVVLGSHLESFVFLAFRKLLRRTTRIYLIGFILTRRRNRLLDSLRIAYFRKLFALIDGVICHSSLEVHRYDEIFPLSTGKFHHIPYGLHIDGHDLPMPFQDPATAPAMSAGRSGRDYNVLCRVFASTGYPLRIVCDSERATDGCTRSNNIVILRTCYDECYIKELRESGMIIVPLSVQDISAGQMVLIQAMAFRKPMIVTRTPTIDEYLTDGKNALLVNPGDEGSLRLAVERLRTDTSLGRRLATEAYSTYLEQHSMSAFVSNLVATLTSMEKTAGNRRASSPEQSS